MTKLNIDNNEEISILIRNKELTAAGTVADLHGIPS